MSRNVDDAYRLSDSSGYSMLLLVAVGAVAGGVWILTNRTLFGLQVRLIGDNPRMARWQGVNTPRLIMEVSMLTGASAGLAGALLVLGPVGRVSAGMSGNVGFTAILAAVLGALTVPGTLLASLILGCLAAAVTYLPIATDLPPSAIEAFQGLLTVLVTCRVGYELLRRRHRNQQPGPAPRDDTPVRLEEAA